MTKDSFDAVVRFRAPKELKAKIEAIAARRTQDISEYLRQRCLDIVEEFERQHPGVLDVPAQEPTGKATPKVVRPAPKSHQGGAVKAPHRKAG